MVRVVAKVESFQHHTKYTEYHGDSESFDIVSTSEVKLSGLPLIIFCIIL